MRNRHTASFLAALLILGLAAGPASGAPAKPRIAKEKQAVLDWLARPEAVEKFGRISDAIWRYAELGLQEFDSAKLLADTLEAAGFTVERGLAGMPTCFVASYGSGRPVIGLLGEFDALPGLSQQALVPKKSPVVEGAPGHGCGHNAMGAAAAAAAIAVKEVMAARGLKGTIKVFGSPAEEIVASRPYMIRAGLFEGVDAVIDNHSSSGFGTGYGIDGNALFSTIFTFKGKTAHAAGAPWVGRSALDAVEIMNVAANYLREHLPLTERLHYVILDGGQAPNVVPDRASVWYYVRNTDERLEDMYKRVVDCAKAGALASGAEIDSMRVVSAIHQRHANKAAAELFQRNIELVGMPAWSDEEQAFAKALQKEIGAKETGLPLKVDKLEAPVTGREFVGGGSSDVGDVTLIAPTATITFPGGVPGAIGHHWSNVAGWHGSTAWKGLNAGAKAIAASVIDLLTGPEELAKLRQEFEDYAKAHPYKPFLPADAIPPNDLNKELMDRYRGLLEKAQAEK
ncbi:MAG TPA: amidohydrolase [Candidatus Aminicenantes bacterium]|nr:amidohydrolase [Candidatus Aminicenantes bacterium]HRY64419.1 amidohydrolase [Candidatus Aminicenantes bacterium]HRZ71332.1 amidohydrolase [Candidatus Aminicenantes bacterium]